MRIPSLIILIFLTMTGCDKQRYIRIDASSLSKNNAYINTLTISGSPSTTVALGHDYSFTPTIINLNGSPPSYSINNLPAWLDFNSSTGALTSKAGRPNIDDIGNYTNITITVTTANERAVFEAFAIEVSQPMSYYLANNGSNSNDGLSLASPFHSLDKAISVVKPGDTILLRAGTYAGVTIQENEFGDSNAWITMQPYNNEHVIIDGDIGSRRNTILFRADSLSDGSKPAAYWTIQNLEIRNGGEYSLKIDVPYVKIYHNNLHGAPNDIVKLVGTANNIEIKFNEIHHAGVGTAFQNAQGIDMVASQNVLVANNFVHDIPSVGIYAKGGAKDIIFENNLLVDILDRAIMLGQSTTAKFVKVYDIPGSP
ncbi:MAG: putative Ig domain-containing protein, partial [Gammaproteobacteria bacterium]|nr:putative Ig domain-containing protein [Gammaproteobacteria bacterium]